MRGDVDVIAFGLGVAGGDDVIQAFGDGGEGVAILAVAGAEDGHGEGDTPAGGVLNGDLGGDGAAVGGFDGDAEIDGFSGEDSVVAGMDRAEDDLDGADVGYELAGVNQNAPAVDEDAGEEGDGAGGKGGEGQGPAPGVELLLPGNGGGEVGTGGAGIDFAEDVRNPGRAALRGGPLGQARPEASYSCARRTALMSSLWRARFFAAAFSSIQRAIWA